MSKVVKGRRKDCLVGNLAVMIIVLQILAGQEMAVAPDPDGNGRSELADALRYL